MKIVVIGGSGLVGEKLVDRLRQGDGSVLKASPTHGVDTITGEGLDQALQGADVVVDVSNSPSLEGSAAIAFFEASSQRLLAAGLAAGVRHHIALSVVGTDRMQSSGYFRGKRIQEDLIRASGIPFSILRSTQFFEFGGPIAEAASDGNTVRVPAGALIQPILSRDVVTVLAEIALGRPQNRTLEVGGPEKFRFEEFIAHVLSGAHDRRKVVADPKARYFGTALDEESLVPGRGARLGQTRYDAWIATSQRVDSRV